MNNQRHLQHHQRQDQRELPCLTFSPAAFLKLQFFLHAGETEVGGFGICREEDPLYVTDFRTVKQFTTAVSVEFDDLAVADHFDRCVDAGLVPPQFARIWIHTHPGASPEPSLVDEQTFERVFGRCDWACMFIIGRTGRTFARLQFNAGPAAAVLLPVRVDWSRWPQLLTERQEDLAEIVEGWMDEYGANIYPRETLSLPRPESLSAHLVERLLLGTDEMNLLHERRFLADHAIEEIEQGWEEAFNGSR